jgi:hypothetical protein
MLSWKAARAAFLEDCAELRGFGDCNVKDRR